jgi:hypothetical protein
MQFDGPLRPCRSQSLGCSDQGWVGADRALPRSHTHTPDLPTLGKAQNPADNTKRRPATRAAPARGRRKTQKQRINNPLPGQQRSTLSDPPASQVISALPLPTEAHRRHGPLACRPPPLARATHFLSHVSVLCCPLPGPCRRRSPSSSLPVPCMHACLAPAVAIRCLIRDRQMDIRAPSPGLHTERRDVADETYWTRLCYACSSASHVPRASSSVRKGLWGSTLLPFMSSCLENPEPA